MRRATFASLILLIWAPVAAPARADSTQVVLRVVVNSVNMGDRFVSRHGPEDLRLAKADLRSLGIQLPQGTTSDSSWVSLQTLAPGVRFRIDESNATLILTVAPELLPRQEIAVASRSARNATTLDAGSAFLNYGATYMAQTLGPARPWSLALEAGVRARGWLALSTFSGNAGAGGWNLVRLSSSLTYDNVSRARRIVLGDVAAHSGRLGSSVLVGGIRIASEFGLARDLEITPTHEVDGVLETPSDLELRVNGALVRSDHLAPGTFRYSELGLAPGAGEVTLVVRDAFGGVRTISSPYYRSRSLLEPGLCDYSWTVGFVRRPLGLESFEYRNPVLLGTHRVGWSRTTTLGIGIEGSVDHGLLAPTISRTLGTFGEIQATLGASRDRRETGTAWSITGLSQVGRLRVDLLGEGASEGFANLGAGSNAAPPRLGAALGVSWSSRPLGGIGLRVSRSDVRGRSVEERMSVSWSRRIARQVSMTTRVVRIRGASTDIEANAMLGFQLGPLRSAGLSARRASAGHGMTLHLQQAAPPGPGFEHRLHVEDNFDGRGPRSSVMASRYQGSHGQWGVTRRQQAEEESWEVTAGGSVAWMDGSLFLSRPIRDGFAVVRVRGMPGVPVLVRHQPMGVTDRRGALLVPGLTSHAANSITLDDRSLPNNWSMVERDQVVSPAFRGGGVVDFVAQRFQSVEGRVLMVRHGIATPAEWAGFEIQCGAATFRSIVGRKGLFYFENLPAGEHRARLFLGDTECHFDLRVPASDAITVDLGEIRCEVPE